MQNCLSSFVRTWIPIIRLWFFKHPFKGYQKLIGYVSPRNLLDNLARLGIRASEWTNHKWNAEYCKNASRLRVFVPETGARPVGMGLPRAAWVKLNRLRTGVGRFLSSMHKWGLAPSPNCECGASEQTADHVLTACPIYRAPHGARGLTVLDDETRCWLNNITASI